MRHGITLIFVLSLTVFTTPASPRQASEEEIARAFQMLGEILGLPSLSPEDLKRRVEEVGQLRFTESAASER